ncbi:hypothetical protein V2647_03560 [Tenacibaculum maritimum]|uniref:hypothetical protein n=1 Tax=Tenacibaculum maritimum TaxID=107401 RepID=UPI003875D822
MTIFITEDFKLDLSHLDIKFSDENSFFEKDLIKQQSFPFHIPNERSFIPFFEFVSSHNSVDGNQVITGFLFRNDRYYDAELMILNIDRNIKSIFYYSSNKLTIFDIPLKMLPWPVLNIGDDIYQYAKETIAKDYPDTLINFSEVYHPELYKDNDWGGYSSFLNKNIDGNFEKSLDFIYTLVPVKQMAEIRPFIYVKEIVKFIFSQMNYTVVGDFNIHEPINKALQYHNNSIFYTNKDYLLKSNLILSLSQSNISGYPTSTVSYNKYVRIFGLEAKGSYLMELNVKGSFISQNEEFHIQIYFDNQILTSAIARNNDNNTFERSINAEIHVDAADVGKYLEIRVICSVNTKSSLEGKYEIKGTKRPLYKDFIDLKHLLPDKSVGEYISELKQSMALTSVFDEPTKTVKFNFFNSSQNSTEEVDLSEYMTKSIPRKLNKSLGYKISFDDGETFYMNKKGEFIPSAIGYSSFTLPLQPLKSLFIEGQPAVCHQESNSILFFESNVAAKPLVNDGDNLYSRLGFIHLFLRRWMFQLLNSEEYNQTLKIPIYISSKLNSESIIWFYNNYFLVHNLQRTNINSLFESVKLRIFKLKSYPDFNLMIDDGSGATAYSPPIAFTSSSSWENRLVTQFNTSISIGQFGFPSSFYIDIFANKSYDPQNLDLSFGWEVLNSPDGNASGVFQYQNGDHSIVRFKKSGYINLAGNYNIRLTVVNSFGLKNTIDIAVTVT